MARLRQWSRRPRELRPNIGKRPDRFSDGRSVMTAEWFFTALRHDRAVVLGSLATATLLAWAYLLLGGGIDLDMMDMGGGQMMAMLPEWSVGYGVVVFAMWAVMMIAMMLPSAA